MRYAMRISMLVSAILMVGVAACGSSTAPAIVPPGASGLVLAIEITPATGLSLSVGSAALLTAHAVVTPGSAADTTVRWSVMNATSAVSVSATGNVTLNTRDGGMVCATSTALASVTACVPISAK
jgi:hypothetical protein